MGSCACRSNGSIATLVNSHTIDITVTPLGLVCIRRLLKRAAWAAIHRSRACACFAARVFNGQQHQTALRSRACSIDRRWCLAFALQPAQALQGNTWPVRSCYAAMTAVFNTCRFAPQRSTHACNVNSTSLCISTSPSLDLGLNSECTWRMVWAVRGACRVGPQPLRVCSRTVAQWLRHRRRRNGSGNARSITRGYCATRVHSTLVKADERACSTT